jgi:hypothetical protein
LCKPIWRSKQLYKHSKQNMTPPPLQWVPLISTTIPSVH